MTNTVEVRAAAAVRDGQVHPGRPATGPARGLHLRPQATQANAVVGWGIVVAIYVVLAMTANLPSWLHGVTHHLQNEGGDLPEEVWFLAVSPYSIIHGHNPFFTTYINVPYGANLVANTTMFFPGLLMAPITFIWGPVASFNVLMVLCYAGSATAAYALFRRWVSAKPAAFVGGLLYGFSPYMVAVGYGHLFLLFAVFPPLILLVLDIVLVRQPDHPLRWGLLLGALAAAQFLSSTEVLASSAMLTIAGIVLLMIFRRRQLATHWRFAAVALSGGLVTFGVLCAVPLWTLLFGPQHLHGPAQPVNGLAIYSADVAGLIAPTMNQLISPTSVQHVANQFSGADLAENAAYLGIPLILVLVVFVWRYRRLAIVQFSGAMGLIALILSFGPRLRVDGTMTAVRLPFEVIRHLPLVDSAIPSRYALYVGLFSGMLIAVGLDQLSRSRIGLLRRRWFSTCACGAVAAFALFPLIPNWPYPIANVSVPAFFASSAVRSVPEGSVLLTYPLAQPMSNDAMLWQAEDGFRYRIPAGYLLTPGPNNSATPTGPPTVTGALFQSAFAGTKLPALTPPLLCDVQNDLRIWNVDTIIITNTGADPTAALTVIKATLGAQPHLTKGAYQYSDVQPLLRRAMARLSCQPTPTLP